MKLSDSKSTQNIEVFTVLSMSCSASMIALALSSHLATALFGKPTAVGKIGNVVKAMLSVVIPLFIF